MATAKKTTSKKSSDRILVIVESPAKSKTIGKILGSDYIIQASMGHVRDLASKGLGFDIENNFIACYNRFANLARFSPAVYPLFLSISPFQETKSSLPL